MASTRLVVDAKLAQCEAAIGRPFKDKTFGAKALVTSPQFITIGEETFFCRRTNAYLAIHGDAIASSYFSLKWLKANLDKGMESAPFLATVSRSTVSYWSRQKMVPDRSSYLLELGIQKLTSNEQVNGTPSAGTSYRITISIESGERAA